MIFSGIKKSLATLAVVLTASASFAQMTSGRIVFERKTNLKKIYKDNDRVKNFLKEDMTWKIDSFSLYFNDSLTAFLPIESDVPDEGFMKYLTSHNYIYKNYNQDERVVQMNMMGTEMIVKDTIKSRTWKVTESKRKIAGYWCRKSVWEVNDSTRIYAWFTVDLVPSIGPEGFDGLPGAILGLATEDGSVIYFAKRVNAMSPPQELMTTKLKGKDTYTEEELKALLLEKMGKWVKKEDLDAQFGWI